MDRAVRERDVQIDTLIGDVCNWRNTKPHIVQEALELVLVAILSEHFQGEVFVEINQDTVRAWFFRNKMYVPIEFYRLPGEVFKAMKKMLPNCIIDIEDRNNYNMWRERVHTIMRGTIVRITPSEMHVDLNGWIATMMRHRWNSKDNYSCGKTYMFYIDKVLRPCQVFVSRNSSNHALAHLRYYYPCNKFRCVKRLVGVKSIIETDAFVLPKHIREIAQEMGEVLIVKRKPEVFATGVEAGAYVR